MLPVWPQGGVTQVLVTGANESRVSVQLPQLGDDITGMYPSFEVQYRRHGTTSWTDGADVPNDGSSVQLDGVFPDGLYELRVRGVSMDGSEQTPYTPAATFFTAGNGEHA